MTAEPIRDDKGLSAARVTCDCCGAEITIRAKHETRRHRVSLPGQTFVKLQSMGWSASAAKQTCPTCVAAKRSKNQEEPAMTAPTEDVPQPLREQKREIMALLSEVYDTKAGRYRGEETDKTVAHALGIERWGWVTELRKEFFGDGGENEAKDNLVAEVRAKIRECDALGAALHAQHETIIASLREFNQRKAQLDALLDRLQGKPSPIQKPQLVAR